jgi:hypothetical protein
MRTDPTRPPPIARRTEPKDIAPSPTDKADIPVIKLNGD